MLYLIDDSNLDSLNAGYVHDTKYQSVLTHISDSEQLNKLEGELSHAECIFVHRSFLMSNVTVEDMRDLTNFGEDIPLVIFSGVDPEQAVYKDNEPYYIGGIKKVLFYERLSFFLDYYLKNHQLDLRILSYGPDFKKIYVHRWAVNVMKAIAGKTGPIHLQDMSSLTDCLDFKKIIEISNPVLGITYDELLKKIDDENPTFESFRDNMNQILNSFNQYDENTYTWQ